MITNQQNQSNGEPRKGAMLIFVLALLVLVLVMVVFSVDIAFMQLSRTELRAAVDAAAKAAAGELTLTNGDKKKAAAKGILAASENVVAGKQLLLEEADFEFGQAVENKNGVWVFKKNRQPYTSVRVTAEKSTASKSGPVDLFFAPILGSDTFSPSQVAVASQFQQEIVLCIDRSHSMTFDDSGVSWSYPSGVLGVDFNGDGSINSNDPLLSYPDPYNSRWAQLTAAVDSFISIIEDRDHPPRVGLVTWGSEIGTSTYEYRLTGQTVPAVIMNTPLEKASGSKEIPPGQLFNLLGKVLTPGEMFKHLRAMYPSSRTPHGTKIMDALFGHGSQFMHGGTNLSAGLDAAVNLLDTQGDPDAKKVVVLLTDGQWNRGRDPIEAATDANAKDIIVHTITFLDAAEQTTMKNVAEKTGGRHFHASSATQLKAIFEELARTLPVALTY